MADQAKPSLAGLKKSAEHQKIGLAAQKEFAGLVEGQVEVVGPHLQQLNTILPQASPMRRPEWVDLRPSGSRPGCVQTGHSVQGRRPFSDRFRPGARRPPAKALHPSYAVRYAFAVGTAGAGTRS